MKKGIIIGAVLAGLTVAAYIDDPTIFDTDDTDSGGNNKGMMNSQNDPWRSDQQGWPDPSASSQPAAGTTQQNRNVRTQMKKPLPAGAVWVRPAKIYDRNGFKRPLLARILMIPVGWKTQGGIQWIKQTLPCGRKTPHYNWKATAPDGIGQISILPEDEWTGFTYNSGIPNASYSGCPNVANTNIRQYIINYARRYRPEARVLDYRTHDEMNKVLQMISQQIDRLVPKVPGIRQTRAAGAGQVLIGYRVNGVEVREILTGGVMISRTSSPGVLQGQVMTTIKLSGIPFFAMRMRDGKLDFRKAEMFRRSIKAMPEYEALMSAHIAKMHAINMKGLKDRGDIIRKSNQEINSILNKTWKNTQRMKDRGYAKSINLARGVHTYKSPQEPGGTVDLDNSYKSAWRLNDGTYVLTDDPSFKPFLYLGKDGKQLKRIR